MKSRNKKLLSLLLIFVLVLTIFTGCSSGGLPSGDSGDTTEPRVLRFASDTFETNVMYGLNVEICDEIFNRTDGRIKVDYYPASQLGAYDTVYEELMIGSIDMAEIWLPTTYDIRTAAPCLPGYGRNFEEVKVLLGVDSYMTNKMKEVCAESGIRLLAMVMEGYENVASVKEVTDPFVPGADKNTTTRVAPWETNRMYLDDLGYDGVQLAWGEVPTSLQTGIVDAWTGGNLMYHDAYTGDIIKYSYVANLQPAPTAVLISQKVFDTLSEEDQQIITEVVEEVSAKCFDLAAEAEEAAADRLRAKGVNVVYATEEEMATINNYIRETTWPKYEDVVGKEMIDEMRAELQKAGYW